MQITQDNIMILGIVLMSVSLHEFGHAKSADAAGDMTPRSQGRVTLNPLAHLDPLGTIMIVITSLSGYGIGWGRPVMVTPHRMRNPKWDHFMSVLWGPLVNVLLAIVFALLFRFVAPNVGETFVWFCFYGVVINISLALFNLIPIGPLDGHWLLAALLPPRLGAAYGQWSRSSGMFVLLGVLFIDQFLLRSAGQPEILDTILRKPAMFISARLLGI